jgi:hypothetical protein
VYSIYFVFLDSAGKISVETGGSFLFEDFTAVAHTAAHFADLHGHNKAWVFLALENTQLGCAAWN